MNSGEGCPEVGGQGVGGDGVRPGLDCDGPVAAGGLDELADGPAGLALDPAADCQCREDDGHVRLDRVAQMVVDGPGLQVAFGHPEGFLDLEQLVVGADDELRGHGRPVRAYGEVGDVSLQPGQVPCLRFELAVDALDRAVEGESVLRRGRALIELGRRSAGDTTLLQQVADIIRDPENRRPITVGTASVSQLGTAGLIAGGGAPAAALARELAAEWTTGERSDFAWLMRSSGIPWPQHA